MKFAYMWMVMESCMLSKMSQRRGMDVEQFHSFVDCFKKDSKYGNNIQKPFETKSGAVPLHQRTNYYEKIIGADNFGQKTGCSKEIK